MDNKVIFSTALAAVAGAAAAAAVSYFTAKDDAKAQVDERQKAAMLQADLDAKIKNAVLAQAHAIVPSSVAKVYPPVGKPAKQVIVICALLTRDSFGSPCRSSRTFIPGF